MAFKRKVSAAQRRQMIAEAAYFRAERRGFKGGDPVADWHAAEAEVDAELARIEHEHVVERLEVGLATASKKLAALKRKLSAAKADVKAQWRADAEELAKLRDTLQLKLADVRSESVDVRAKARRQAEKLWDELAEVIHRVSAGATRH